MSRELREERLVELLVGGANTPDERRELEELRHDVGLEGAARETLTVLDEARAAERSTDLTAVREERLIRSILARTTREDLSWRGEFQLLRRFVVERLTHSSALRWVAASLLLHLFALPFFGTELVELVRPAFRIRIEPPTELPAEAEVPPTESLPLPDPEGGPPGADPARIENAIRRARFALSTAAVPPAPPPTELSRASLEIRLLAARSRGLAERTWGAWLEEERELALAGANARALWIEALLDRFVLTGERSALLGPALNRLALQEDSDLGRAALQRAQAYGLWEAPEDMAPEAVPLPLSSDWRALLGRTLVRETGAPHPYLDAWIR